MVKSALLVLLSRRMLFMLLFGFASGLPFALSGPTLQAWYTEAGVDIKQIGLLALVSQPYAFKYIWASFLDYYAPPPLFKRFALRRGWALAIQSLLLVILLKMSMLQPSSHGFYLALLAFVLSFFSASLDIVLDAYRTEVLTEKEKGFGNSWYITGYRLGLLLSTAGALVLADKYGFNLVYLLMALVVVVSMLVTTLAEQEPIKTKQASSLFAALQEAIKDLFMRNGVRNTTLIIGFIIIYKLGDAFSLSLTTVFMRRELGFSLTEIAAMSKTMGVVAGILGGFIGGIGVYRLGLYSSLLLFGGLQAVSNILFAVLAMVGKNYIFTATTMFIEHLCAGMGTVAFASFIMSICNKRYTAFQYALLSSLAVLGRTYVAPISGYMVASIGWINFFIFTFFIALPSIVMLLFMKKLISSLGKQG